jgi:hypothetical protein
MQLHARKASTESSNDGNNYGHAQDFAGRNRQPSVLIKDDNFLSKEGRLIDWVAGLLQEHIKRVVARRQATQKHHNQIMSVVVKLTKRTVTPDLDVDKFKTSNLVSQLHD